MSKTPQYPKRPQECELLTPPGRIFWAHFFRPKPPSTDGKGPASPRYTCDFVISKEVARQSPEWGSLTAALAHYAKGKFTKADLSSKQFVLGFRDGDEFNDEQYHGCVVLRPWTGETYPPSVINEAKETLTEASAPRIPIGANARLMVAPFAFDNKLKGMGLNLKLVWLIGGDPITVERDWSTALEGVEALPDYAAAAIPKLEDGLESDDGAGAPDPFSNQF